MKKLLVLLFASVVVFPLASAIFAQEAPAQAKEDRWEGNIIRTDKDKSTLTVRKPGGTLARTVEYDSSTKWVSQYHGDNQVNNIDPSQVKEGDRVICKGTFDKNGVLHATVINKRLSHSK